MRFLYICLGVCALAFCPWAFGAITPESLLGEGEAEFRGIDPSRVVVLVNSASGDGRILARHFAREHQILPENIIELEMPLEAEIGRAVFERAIFYPLVRRLFDLKLLRGSEPQADGPSDFRVEKNDVDFVVLLKGVPLGIGDIDGTRAYKSSVDMELAKLAMGPSKRSRPENPLYANETPAEKDRAKVVRVVRLDAPRLSQASDMIDRARQAQERGFWGRIYVALNADSKAVEVADFFRDLGYEKTAYLPLSWQKRWDAPVFWMAAGNEEAQGPFLYRDMFRMARGGIAILCGGQSLSDLNDKAGWGARLAACGACVIAGRFGNEAQDAENFDALKYVQALKAGKSHGEALYLSLKRLGGDGIYVGDPFYRPFAQKSKAQFALLNGQKADAYAPYFLAQVMRLLTRRQNAQEALWVGESYAAKRPSFEVLNLLGELAGMRGDGALARRFYERMAELPLLNGDDFSIALQAARKIGKEGLPNLSLKIYSRLCADIRTPKPLLELCLEEAMAIAQSHPDLAQEWRAQTEEFQKISRP